MALEGSLQDFGLADILQLIYHQKKTGTLTMKNSSAEGTVLFENGLVVMADISNTEGLDKIGEVLLRSGKIVEDQLKQALITQRRTKEKIGVILVTMGAISTEDLIKALGLHAKEAVLSLFKWKEGRYIFELSDISYHREYWLPINTEYLVMEGVRRIDEWPNIEKKIPHLDLVFEKNKKKSDKISVARTGEESSEAMPEGSNGEEGFRITQEEMIVYNLVDGRKDVRHMVEVANIGEFETCKALSNLLTAGLIFKKPFVEPQRAEGEKIEEIGQAIDRKTGGRLISGFIITACLLFWGSGLDQLIEGLQQPKEVMVFYHQLESFNKVKRVGFSIMTYFFRYNRLPESLEVLIRGYSQAPGDFARERAFRHRALESAAASWNAGLSGRDVLYEPNNEMGTFVIEVRR